MPKTFVIAWLVLGLMLAITGCRPYRGPSSLPNDPWNVPGTSSGTNTGPLKATYLKIVWSTQVTNGDLKFFGDIALAGETACYLTSMDGRLHALDGDGKLLWSKRVSGLYSNPSPVIFEGQILIASNADWISCLEPSGAMEWRRSIVNRGMSEIMMYPLVGAEDSIFVLTTDNLLKLGDEGKVLTKVSAPGHTSSDHPSLLPNGGFCFTTNSGHLVQVDADLKTTSNSDLGQGHRLHPRPAVIEDRILVASKEGLVAAVDFNGKVLWQVQVQGDFSSDGAVAKGSYLCLVDYVGTGGSRYVWVFDVGTGEIVKRIPHVDGSKSLVASSSEPLVACLEPSALVVHNIESGDETSRVPLDGGILSTMSIRPDGILIIGTSSGKVLAVE